MPKFQFRLQGVLRLREAKRDRRREDLADAYRAEDVLRQQLDQLHVEMAEASRLRAPGAGALEVDALIDAARFHFVLSAQQQTLDIQCAEVAEEVERRRVALVEADRQVRLLEKLRDIKQANHQQEQSRIETKALDEVAGTRHQARNQI